MSKPETYAEQMEHARRLRNPGRREPIERDNPAIDLIARLSFWGVIISAWSFWIVLGIVIGGDHSWWNMLWPFAGVAVSIFAGFLGAILLGIFGRGPKND